MEETGETAEPLAYRLDTLLTARWVGTVPAFRHELQEFTPHWETSGTIGGAIIRSSPSK